MGTTNRTEPYTDLRWAYFFKIVVFLGIATLTIVQSKDLDSLLLNCITYLSGICFDFYISAHSNNGPLLKTRRLVSNVIFAISFIVIIALIAILLSNDLKTKVHNYSNEVNIIIKVFMFGFGSTGPFIEFISNFPNND